MMTLWRLSNHATLDSGQYSGGRWLPAGANAVLLDVTPLAAMCARLALVEAAHPRDLPRSYRLLEVQVPESGGITFSKKLPSNWKHNLAATRELGETWLQACESLLLRLPTLSGGFQYLLNCAHPAAALCTSCVAASYPFKNCQSLSDGWLQDGDWLAKL